jgi:hypothetical protein
LQRTVTNQILGVGFETLRADATLVFSCDTLLKIFCRNTILLSSALRPAFIADGLTFHNVPIFATRFTLSQNLAASIIKEGFGTLNFDVGRGALTPAAY